jgi:TonB family protein
MKSTLLLLLVFASAPLFAQQPVYQQFEVDSSAQPRGGMAYLQLFLQTNLRKPIAAQAAGKAIRTTVTGIIEPDGRLTDVKAIPSNSPDADREAVRVFSLFNAWQPAQKGGERVRQTINFPVMFKANEPFEYANGARIDYFDVKYAFVPMRSEQARFRQVTPLDANGINNGDVILEKGKGTDWKEVSRTKFVQKMRPASSSGPTVQVVGQQTDDHSWTGNVFTLSTTGDLLEQQHYQNGIPDGMQTTYHANGIVQQQALSDKESTSSTSWYPTGQLKQTRRTKKPMPGSSNNPETVGTLWTSDGKQLVKDGNGLARYENPVWSKESITFVEEGLYQDGVKQGRWTGHYSDDSYFYDETYDKGAFLGGKAVSQGSDTIRYRDREVQPQFEGGMEELGQFLSTNLRYPASAQRESVQGRVFVSFVVCEDGSLCDYEVLKGVHPDVDKEALRVTKIMNGHWKPGIQRGKKVKVKYNLPINFSLH